MTAQVEIKEEADLLKDKEELERLNIESNSTPDRDYRFYYKDIEIWMRVYNG